MSKFCTKCGNQVSDEVMFCDKCGAEFEKTDVTPSNVNTTSGTVSGEAVVPPPEATGKKKKFGKKAILLSSIALVLVAAIVIGFIAVPSLMSSGYPQIITIDEDTAEFDLNFDQFKKSFTNCIEPVWTTSHYSNYSDISVNDYINAFNDENKWYSWESGDTENHKWTYNYSDSLTYEINVAVDNNTKKIKFVTSTSYYPDIITKLILTTCMVYGDKNIEEDFESIYNLMLFISEYVEEKSYVLSIDNMCIMSYESESYCPTYYYVPETEDGLKEYSITAINLTHEDLSHFDVALSSRYGIDYKWLTK